ncbi:MAG: hypothetical protein OEM02_07660, partial [Desulfobulbaceae bacterium]|nr:hypothetical protein [Desulfobulbaceae bacterium]
MNTPQEHETIALDAAEDLTLYADEEFDNEDVDLFEFTTVDDHPLATLKSIILSLEWEINDDILEQLGEEVRHLREEWAGDKIVLLYLQGIDKIGRYIRSEQAYAHPNSIKLLNSYFYNLEQILSNPDLADDDVVLLLKGDLRKFKILQYQISLTRKDAAADHHDKKVTEEVKASSYYEHLRSLKAVVLGLDWEITDRDLEEFHTELIELKNIYQTEAYTLVLINGLLTIGAYISEQRIKAHPEAFSLLYAFFESLESFLLNDDISEKEQKEIIIDRVQRLNNLKSLVSGESDTTEDLEEDIVEEKIEPVEMEEEPFLDSTEQAYIQQIAPQEKTEDILFEEKPMVEEEPVVEEAPELEIAAPTLQEDEIQPEPESVITEIQPEPESVVPETKQDKGEITFDLSDEIDTHISSFFDDIGDDESIILDQDEITAPADPTTKKKTKIITDSPISSALSFDPLAEQLEFLDDDAIEAIDEQFSDSETKENQLAPALSQLEQQSSSSDVIPPQNNEEDKGKELSSDDVIIPALSDSDEIGGFNEDAAGDEQIEIPKQHIDDKLDSFFGKEVQEKPLSAQTPTPPVELKEEKLDIIPALADSSEEGGFDDKSLSEEQAEIPQKDIDAKLASFFDEDKSATQVSKEIESTSEEKPVVAALADSDEEIGFREDDIEQDKIEIPQDTIDDKL